MKIKTFNQENSRRFLLNWIIEPKQQIPDERKRFSNTALKNLILPIIVEQFLALLVGIADTLMVSHVGEAAVSAVSLVNHLGGILWNLAFFLITPFILNLYNLSSEAMHLVLILVLLHNIFNALFCPVSFSVSNGMRAAGDAKYTMYASIFATVICRTALSVLFGVILNLGIIGITLAMICDWTVKAVLILLRWKSGKWKNFKVI